MEFSNVYVYTMTSGTIVNPQSTVPENTQPATGLALLPSTSPKIPIRLTPDLGPNGNVAMAGTNNYSSSNGMIPWGVGNSGLSWSWVGKESNGTLTNEGVLSVVVSFPQQCGGNVCYNAKYITDMMNSSQTTTYYFMPETNSIGVLLPPISWDPDAKEATFNIHFNPNRLYAFQKSKFAGRLIYFSNDLLKLKQIAPAYNLIYP
jgi:hypothetical protein